MAFKATDEDDRGVSASGVVRDDTGTEITRFSTSHNGMGKVSFVPEEGRTYSTEYVGPDGEIRTAEIGVSLVKQAFTKDGGNVMPKPIKLPRGGIPLADIERVIPFDAVERIDFLRNNEALILDNLEGDALMITTKDGAHHGIKTQFELKYHIPLGYQKYKEYASPMLASATDVYDLENASTLLWLPSSDSTERERL